MDTQKARYVVDKRGEKTDVIIPLKEFKQIVENLHDLAMVADRRKEKPVSLQETRRWLKKHGHL